MKKLTLIIIVFSTLFFLFSCETIVDLDMPVHEPKLVVNSYFEPGKNWETHVSASVHILERKQIPNITNAKVVILENGNFLEELEHIADGIYIGQTSPLQGKLYTVEVSAPGFNPVSGSDQLPPVVPVISATIKDSALVSQWGETLAEISIKISDPGNVKNFYQLSMSRVDYYIDFFTGDTTYFINYLWYETKDPSFDAEMGTKVTFSDKLYDGKDYEILLWVNSWDVQKRGISDELKISLSSLSEKYYLYEKSVNNQQWNEGDPFSEPVQIRSNINGGYGVFAGRSTSEFVILIE